MNPVSNKMLRAVFEKNTEAIEELRADIEKLKSRMENKEDLPNLDNIYRDMQDRWKTISDTTTLLDVVKKKCNF